MSKDEINIVDLSDNEIRLYIKEHQDLRNRLDITKEALRQIIKADTCPFCMGVAAKALTAIRMVGRD